MKGFFVILTLLLAFIGEWSFTLPASKKGIFLPLAALAFCFWSWRIRFETRLWLGLAVGFIMDTMQLVPFGTYMLTLVTIAILCELFQLFFSNTESKITYSIGVVFLMLAFFGAFPLYNIML